MELTGPPALAVVAVSVRSHTHQGLHAVSFSVASGEALAIVGRNGSGRTTLLRAVAGITPVDAGTIRWQGRDVTRMPTARRVALGISMVAGGQAVFAGLTVADNLLTGCHRFAWDRERVARRMATVTTLFPRLGERPTQLAGSLSGGEQQMLVIAKALVGEPRLLLLDEPTLGLAAEVADQLAAAVRALCRDGLTLVVVEQTADAAARFASRAVHLDRGTVIGEAALGITPPEAPQGVQS